MYRPSDTETDITVGLFDSDVRRTSREKQTRVVFILVYFIYAVLKEVIFTAYLTRLKLSNAGGKAGINLALPPCESLPTDVIQ